MLVANLPTGSAVWAAERDLPLGTTPTDVILADIYHALTGELHPIRPTRDAEDNAARTRHESHAEKLLAQRERLMRAREEATE